MIPTLPIVRKDFGEQTRQDTEVADGEDVDVDHMAQTVNHYSQNRNRSAHTYQNVSFLPSNISSIGPPERMMAVIAMKRWKSMAASKGMYRLRKVSLHSVMRLRHTVSSM